LSERQRPRNAKAQEALDGLKAEWKEVPQISNKELFAYLKQNGAANTEDRFRKQKGSVEDGLAVAAHRLDASYTVAYIAHAPLEPRAAVAQWAAGKLTVWTGTQRPFANRDELAAIFHLPESSVRVIVPDTGSAYGGKHTSDAAIEAARLARAAGPPRQGGVDARGRIHLGVFPSRWCHRNQERHLRRRHADSLGISQLPFRVIGD